ncbi:MAG: hypothetical protein KAJ62_07900 [Desulfobacteraceae bacterium]|nr:hypothetical protein [Desulfobacteraceae bacterium]
MTTGILSNIRINKLVYLLLFLSVCLIPVDLYAHKVYVFAWAENGKVFTESKFSSNKFVKNGKILVQDEKSKTLLTGITSDNGSFSFDIPDNLESDILIKLDAGMGHKGEWKLELEEMLKAKTGGNSKETAQKKKDEKIKIPSIANVSAGILIIFIFFILMAYYKKKLKKND